MNAQFILPDFYTGMPLYSRLIEKMKEYPEIVRPNTEIFSIFGIFPGSIWNGGGITVNEQEDYNFIKDCIEFYNFELGIPLSFTFTNTLINEKHCFDTYSNIIAELGNNGHNKILVCEGPLEEYLRKNYTKYEYCRSIIDAKDAPYLLNGIYGDYELSVLRRNKNNKWDYLNTIPQEDRDRIELLCNDPCPDCCMHIYTHYKELAQRQLQFKPIHIHECKMEDVKGPFPQHNMQINYKTYISREMIDNDYLPKGFTKFKCTGRWSRMMIMLNIFNYIIKPEYHDDICLQFIHF